MENNKKGPDFEAREPTLEDFKGHPYPDIALAEYSLAKKALDSKKAKEKIDEEKKHVKDTVKENIPYDIFNGHPSQDTAWLEANW